MYNKYTNTSNQKIKVFRLYDLICVSDDPISPLKSPNNINTLIFRLLSIIQIKSIIITQVDNNILHYAQYNRQFLLVLVYFYSMHLLPQTSKTTNYHTHMELSTSKI